MCGALQGKLQDMSGELKYMLRQVLVLNVGDPLVLVETSSLLSSSLPMLT